MKNLLFNLVFGSLPIVALIALIFLAYSKPSEPGENLPSPYPGATPDDAEDATYAYHCEALGLPSFDNY